MKKKVSLKERVKKESESSEKFEQGFRMVPMEVASLEKPIKQGLSIDQSELIKRLFSEYRTAEVSKDKLNEDLQQTLELSSGIKNIVEQSALMVGERIRRAQEVMSNYRGGMFNKWLLVVFGNKVTPYNMLNYYNLHKSIADLSIRALLEKLPKRAAYKLASRKGDLEEKIEILTSSESSEKSVKNKNSQIVSLIEKKFPIPETDNRTLGNKIRSGDSRNKIMSFISKIQKLEKEVKGIFFTDQDKEELEDTIALFQKWISCN